MRYRKCRKFQEAAGAPSFSRAAPPRLGAFLDFSRAFHVEWMKERGPEQSIRFAYGKTYTRLHAYTRTFGVDAMEPASASRKGPPSSVRINLWGKFIVSGAA
jgi:hypothetical protein